MNKQMNCTIDVERRSCETHNNEKFAWSITSLFSYQSNRRNKKEIESLNRVADGLLSIEDAKQEYHQH